MRTWTDGGGDDSRRAFIRSGLCQATPIQDGGAKPSLNQEVSGTAFIERFSMTGVVADETKFCQV